MALVNWIKKSWNDPVWSAVFGTLIAALLIGIVEPVRSFVIFCCQFLINTRVDFSINLLLILSGVVLVGTILIISLITAVNVTIGELVLATRLDVEDLLKGQWLLTFKKGKQIGVEECSFEAGKRYLIRHEHAFNLTNIQVDVTTKSIAWTKENINGPVHSVEDLLLKTSDLLTGKDSLGYNLEYRRSRPRGGVLRKMIIKIARKRISKMERFSLLLHTSESETRFKNLTQKIVTSAQMPQIAGIDADPIFVGGSFALCPSCKLGVQIPYPPKEDNHYNYLYECPYCHAEIKYK